MEAASTLANTPLDLQITICLFLRPSDILALRKTCKALEFATRKRVVWVAALHRVCFDNTLFLPSFPIPDMSDLELEGAAMAPRRWLELCGALQNQHSNNSSEMLHPRATRIIEHGDSSHFFIVPGGRYLVTAGRGIMVWDLGYVSTVDCKLVASVGPDDGLYFEFCVVRATPDGKGLVILAPYNSDRLYIFEIYPQSETPLLTQIALLDWFSFEECIAHFLSDIIISRVHRGDKIVFKVVDYRTNHSTCFSAEVDMIFAGGNAVETFATKTAIIFLDIEEIFIWAIPPLSPQPSDLRHFLDNNSTHTPPLLRIPFPDGIVRTHENYRWLTVSSWYLSLDSVYIDFFYTSKLQRFNIIIKPDLSDASLHVINISNFISDDLMLSLGEDYICDYRICEDAFVYFWNNSSSKTWVAYTGLISAPFTNVLKQWNGQVGSLCPASGRFVYRSEDGEGRIAVVDLI